MGPETLPALSSPAAQAGILSAVKASMVAHPLIWTLGTVAIVGAIGYFVFFRESTPETPAAAPAPAAS